MSDKEKAALKAVLDLCQTREDSEAIEARVRGYRAPRRYANESTLVTTALVRRAISTALDGK